ncbi:RNA-binding protein Jag [hydrothermal vent metagenome]|uniref:RNA-binding protein Jag n=1 Tax=hydrothermal vent metagenome TaxID=652676 RepID=A0A1W1CMV4_9ZZZZ
MEMKRIEADTLEEAYSKAAKALACSVTEINYEIVQYPTSGVMGLFKKTAIIIAIKKTVEITKEPVQEKIEKVVIEEKEEIQVTKTVKEPFSQKVATPEKVISTNDTIVDNFFNNDIKEKVEKTEPIQEKEESEKFIFDDDREQPENRERSIDIENKILKLMDVACFHIDTVEVDVFNGIAHIFLDGEDAALLIGKEGYRYNALSYMLFNWINAEYNLYIKLEISEFIQAQEEMIDNYLKPIAEHILEHGRGKTKPLDGILVQIALEKLRAMFPNKYIAIKTGKDARKFIIINDFNSKKKNS